MQRSSIALCDLLRVPFLLAWVHSPHIIFGYAATSSQSRAKKVVFLVSVCAQSVLCKWACFWTVPRLLSKVAALDLKSLYCCSLPLCVRYALWSSACQWATSDFPHYSFYFFTLLHCIFSNLNFILSLQCLSSILTPKLTWKLHKNHVILQNCLFCVILGSCENCTVPFQPVRSAGYKGC